MCWKYQKLYQNLKFVFKYSKKAIFYSRRLKIAIKSIMQHDNDVPIEDKFENIRKEKDTINQMSMKFVGCCNCYLELNQISYINYRVIIQNKIPK